MSTLNWIAVAFIVCCFAISIDVIMFYDSAVETDSWKGSPMMNIPVRDQIADVLAHHPACNLKDEGYSAEYVLRMADAVIAELGLKHYCRDCGGWGPMDD